MTVAEEVRKKVGMRYPDAPDDYFRYYDCKKDNNGWVNAKSYLPADYDLMHLKLHTGKVVFGWISGTNWDGLRIKPGDEVLFWRKSDKE